MSGVTVESKADHPFTVTGVAGNHLFLVDEPKALGGDDSGPTPYDYLLAALGSCTAMTLSMYANRKGWPLERIAIRLSHDRIQETEEGRAENPSSRFERITCEIELTGEIDATQREKLLEIATKCPVHRTLLGGVQIVDRLAVAQIDRNQPPVEAVETWAEATGGGMSA